MGRLASTARQRHTPTFMKIAFSEFDATRDLFDTLIDVRSPAEFEEDHIPGAINLPVLSNDERAKVGAIYVQDDPFKARKIGAALVAKNTADHLQTVLKDKPGGWRPLTYCWRGGQRSGSFATILSEIGWRVAVLEGGYKSYRRAVRTQLYDAAPPRLVVLDGDTGSGKTELLHRLAARGAQVIDLEGLANHRGSIFGFRPGGQPSQKAFETALAEALRGLDCARPILVEAESAKVGRLNIPPVIWGAMGEAPRLLIRASAPARAGYLARAYADLAQHAGRLRERIEALRPFHSAETMGQWLGFADAGAHEKLARALIEAHYDPRYRRERERQDRDTLAELTADALDDEDLDRLADAIQARLEGLDQTA